MLGAGVPAQGLFLPVHGWTAPPVPQTEPRIAGKGGSLESTNRKWLEKVKEEYFPGNVINSVLF